MFLNNFWKCVFKDYKISYMFQSLIILQLSIIQVVYNF